MIYKAAQGDLIWLDFNPQTGHEQKGHRPALIVSNNDANRFLDPMAFVCPVTSTDRRYPTHIGLDGRTKLGGFVMCEQMRAVDLRARNAEFAERLPRELMNEVADILYGIVEIRNSN